jgi:hypothetical protein
MQLEQLYPNSLKRRIESMVGVAIQDVIKNPLQVAFAIEERLPGMAVQVLSLAAEIIEPHLRGVGFKILEFNDESILARVPLRQKNLNAWTHELQSGTLMSCAEFAQRLMLQRYLDPSCCEIKIKESNIKRMSEISSEVLLTIRLDADSREGFLLDLFSKGKAQIALETLIFNPKRQIVAQLSSVIVARSTPRLGS